MPSAWVGHGPGARGHTVPHVQGAVRKAQSNPGSRAARAHKPYVAADTLHIYRDLCRRHHTAPFSPSPPLAPRSSCLLALVWYNRLLSRIATTPLGHRLRLLHCNTNTHRAHCQISISTTVGPSRLAERPCHALPARHRARGLVTNPNPIPAWQ
jgi:hypothetical protein